MKWHHGSRQAELSEIEEIIPVADMIDHEHEDCVCGPLTVVIRTDPRHELVFVLHHSLDGREYRRGFSAGGTADRPR